MNFSLEKMGSAAAKVSSLHPQDKEGLLPKDSATKKLH